MRNMNPTIEWFDDLKLGMRFASDKLTVTKEDILRFAAEFDPQPFHTDEVAAKSTILNGLAASGWHTAAIAMRLAITARPFGPHPLLGAGVDDPIRPDGPGMRRPGRLLGSRRRISAHGRVSEGQPAGPSLEWLIVVIG